MINKLFLLLGLFFIANLEIFGQCTTTLGGTVGGSNTYCVATDPVAFTSSAAASGGTGTTLGYQWESSPNNTNWTEISGATTATYNPPLVSTTTYFRRKSRKNSCVPLVWGANSNTLVVTILASNAGPDQGKCGTTTFTMAGNAAPTAPAGYAGTWSVVSGTATITTPSSPTSNVTLSTPTATLRWTLSNGTCTKTDDVVLTNTTNTISLSTPLVSACINQPLQDIVTVDVNVSWTTTVPGHKINVTHNNKTETIDPAVSTSPQTIRFLLPADNTSGKTISAAWTSPTCTAVTSSAFSVPAACSSDQLNCNILYLCGLDKPYDGDPFDHGLMDYITSVNGGTVSGALTKADASGYGLYDLNSTTTLLSLNLNDYGLIIISPTTEGHMAAGLVNALKGWKGSVLNMNYAIMQNLGYSANNYVSWSNDAYINAVETLLNYDNPTSYTGKLLTLGDYYSTAIPYVWKDLGSKNANLGGVAFKYAPHTNTQLSSTHGNRVYLGYHMNGIWGNATNGGVLPAPVSSYFAPTKHLTQKGKEVLDNALIAAATCTPENCTNNIDDDGDGLVDCLDPDCNSIVNPEFDNGSTSWNLYTQAGSTATFTIDATKQLSGQNSAMIATTATSGTEWHVQLAQGGNSIVAGKTYKISFRARASAARNASVAMQLGASPYTSYFYNTFALTTTSQGYSYEFTPTVTISNVTLIFNLAAVTGTVWIDQVEFKEVCGAPVLSCPSECPSPNQLINSSFPLDVTGWTTNGITEVGGGGTYGNFIVLNNADAAGPFTVYQEYTIGANKEYLFNGYVAKHPASNNAKVYLEFYNGTTFISKTTDFNVTKNYDNTFQAITPVLGYTPAGTTKIRVVGWCAGTAIKLDELSLKVCVPKPTITSSTPGSRCGSGTVNLVANASAGVVNWYTAPTGGTTLFTGTTFTTPSISATTTYYAEAVNSGCYSASRTAVVATVSSCVENCTNGIDDDGDGFVDCADSDCLMSGCLSNYNFVSFGPVNVQHSDIQGKVLYCDNVTVSNYAIGSKLPLGNTETVAFVNGNFSMTNGAVQGGKIMATGAVSLTNVTNELGNVTAPPPLYNQNVAALPMTCSVEETYYTTLSNNLKNMTPNGTFTVSGSDKIFNCNNITGTVVFNISLSSDPFIFTYGLTYLTNHSNVKSVIINVTHSDPIFHSININESIGLNSSKIIWNFPNATRIRMSAIGWKGTVLAPLANLVMENGHIDGNVITNGFIMNDGTLDHPNGNAGEFHTCYNGTDCGISTKYIGTLPNINFVGCEAHYPITPVLPQSTLCVGSTMQLFPTTNVSWTSSNPSVATISSSGLITGVSSGNVTFTFSNVTTGCLSNTSANLVVVSPSVASNTPGSRCGSGTVSLSATTSAGTLNWYSAASGGTSLFTGASFTTPFISTTTTYYVDATNAGCTSARTAVVATINNCGENCTNGIDDDGDGLADCLDADCAPTASNAGSDITQCMNSSFLVIGNNPVAGQTGQWSVRSGSAILSWPTDNDSLTVTLASGLSSTLRWTITKGSCTSIDSVVISNTTSCTTTCIDAINPNGDLENEGTATNFNLTFQGTPALLMTTGINPAGWVDAYGTTAPNTATFQGSYYIKKTGVNGNPHSGTHMIYSGGGYCFSPLATEINVSCGKTYKISAWAAAYTNGPSQLTTPFAMEFFASGSTMPTVFSKSMYLNAPASTSWNNLNWQRYEMIVTIPSNINPENANFLFTTSDPTRGLVVDDVCITVVSSGSDAIAGPDQYGCTNVFALAANTPPAGYTGTWTVVSGAATLSSTNSPTATATITSGTTATLAWSVSDGGTCSNVDNIVLAYSNSSISVNNVTVCAGSPATLTVTGCTGSLSWSTGATTTSINVSPTSTTSYQVTCTPTPSANLALNAGFESATNMQDWGSWGGTYGVTTVVSEIRTGAKAAKIDATTNWGGFAQMINAVPGEKYTISFYAKATNTNAEPKFQYRFANASYAGIVNWSYLPITSSSYQLYTITSVSPLNTAFLEYSFNTGPVSILFIDDVSVTKVNSCVKTATGTVTTNPLPGTKIIQSGSRCGPGSVELKVLFGAGNSNWYSAATGGTLLGTGNTFNTPSISSTTTYYIEGEQNGCISATRQPITATINPFPTISLNGPAAICIDGNTAVTASISGGTWTSSNTAVATVNASGVVTGIAEGTAIITYVSGSGCNATNTIAIDVDKNEQKTITGDNTLCLGETADFELSNSGSGTWGVLNSSVLTINQDGEVTTVAPGTTLITFTQANNVCGDTAFYAITVNPIPVITLTGPTTICKGDQNTSLSSNIAGGTWQSSNTSVATISSTGVITAISAGQATFTYIASGTLCSSLPSTTITVRPVPTITINGSPNLCLNANAVLFSSIAGTWSSNNPTIATIGTNNGVITAISPGSATFNFTSTDGSCVTTAPQEIKVASPMTVTIESPTPCYTTNQSLSAQIIGGNGPFTYVWSGPGLNSTASTVTIGSAGTYNLIVQSNYGCQQAANLTISPTMTGEIISPDTVCPGTIVGIQTNIIGGVYQWSATAQNSTSAVVNVVPASPSTLYTVSVTNAQGCVNTFTKTIQVYQKPIISFTGTDTVLCPGSTTSFSANVSGYWFSSNPSVATISNSGIVTAVDSGTVRFIFQNYNTNCFSDSSIQLVIRKEPTISSSVENGLCIGAEAQLTTNTAGTWANNNPTIASISNTGLITGLSVGLASFDFTSASGCQSSANYQIAVNLKPIVSLTGDSIICIGSTTQFFPATSGTWQSGNVNVATMTTTGLVTGIGAGSTRFVYTSAGGCKSDSSKIVIVNSRPLVSVSGPNTLCVGNKTQMVADATGQWEGLNNDIAIISSSGEVTAISSGTARFRFRNSLTNCYSNASDNITIMGRPIVDVLGSNILCIGSTSSLTPNNSGTWISSDTAVARVTNNGIVTAIGPGSATFVFTNSITGCVSNATLPIQVQDKAPVSIVGSDVICVGSTTQLLPDFGGIWESNDTSIASVNFSGVVTGKKIGSTTFKFTPTSGCASNNTAPVTVGTAPSISINGPSVLCVGDTSLMSPGTGGQWTSTNSLVATITNTGKITALSQGQSRFIFTTTSGCVSNASLPIIINAPPSPPFIPRTSLCVADSLLLSPNISSTWISSNPSVATVDNQGKVRAISSGTVRFRYIDNQTGCMSNFSAQVTVEENSVITGDANTLCLGSTMTLAPFAQGIWVASNPDILSVSTNGNQVVIFGKNPGTATVKFTNSVTGCSSLNEYPITVGDQAIIKINRLSICIGDTTQIQSTNMLGTWSSLTPSIATITPTGIITAKAKGTASFSFLQNNSTCAHVPNQILTVLERPFVAVDGLKDICIDATTQLLPKQGGTWISLNASIATVNTSGLVTGVGQGTAKFTFIEAASGCTSDSSLAINVGEMPPPLYTGPEVVCLGYSSSLTAGVSQSVWSSSDAAIAKISADGVFTGLAPGKVRFRYTDASNNCQSGFLPNFITVKNCVDPDFNVTGINYKIYGNLATNDDIPGANNPLIDNRVSGERTTTVRYGQPILDFKPMNSNSNLFVDESGAYSFITNTPGKYRYKVPVCINDEQFGCPTMILELAAVDTRSSEEKLISNLDIGTVYGGVTKVFNTLSNDRVLNGSTNSLPAINWANGSKMLNTVSGSADMWYTAANVAGRYGMDTMNYSMCWPDPSSSNCYSSSQFIVVNAPSALNSIVGADDFITTPSATQVKVNVLSNDMDPENNTITITPQGSESSMINIPSGRYCVESDGDLIYIPSNGFYGSVDIVYNICDNNINQECTKATAHILVLEDMRIKTKVYLEGALISNGGALSSKGKPLMRDELRYNLFNNKRSIPIHSPYKVSAFDTTLVNLPALYARVNDDASRNSAIVDSNVVFGVTGENAIVDWVYVQLRSKTDNKVIIGTRSGLVQRDGDIVDLDGVSDLSFSNIVADSFYVMVKHRNHLGAMSGLVANGTAVDFTNPNTPIFNFGTSLNNGLNYTGLSMNPDVIQGYTALWAGDMNSDGLIKYTAPDDDRNIILSDALLHANNTSFTTNYDFAIGYYQGDFNLNAKAKHDNPDDDTNYLFGQVILYPLNNVYLANYGLLVEQVPK